MLITHERRAAIRTIRGCAIFVLQEVGAISECEEHGWMQERADPHARERAFDVASRDPPAGVSPDAAAACAHHGRRRGRSRVVDDLQIVPKRGIDCGPDLRRVSVAPRPPLGATFDDQQKLKAAAP
jgi:hypothetical protein